MKNVSLYLHNHVKSDGTCTVYVRTRVNKKYVFLNTEVTIDPEKFDHDAEKVTGKGAKNKNLLLDEAKGRVSDIILRYKINKKTLTKDLLEREFYNPASIRDFFGYMEQKAQERIGEITKKSYNQHIAALTKFKRYVKRDELLFVELDENLILNFYTYLKRNIHNSSNTAFNNIKNIKIYVLKAYREGLIQSNPFANLTFKRDFTYPEFLTDNELASLWKIYDSPRLLDSHKKVLRWFLFCTETGLRISDLREITHDNILFGTLVFTPQKTKNINNSRVDIPLTSRAQKIINEENTQNGKIFRCYSEPRMRKYLKEILPVAGITRNMSFHASRHTFATQFLKRIDSANGILILQKLLGHAHLESTMVYLHVINNDIIDAMQKFDNNYNL